MQPKFLLDHCAYCCSRSGFSGTARCLHNGRRLALKSHTSIVRPDCLCNRSSDGLSRVSLPIQHCMMTSIFDGENAARTEASSHRLSQNTADTEGYRPTSRKRINNDDNYASDVRPKSSKRRHSRSAQCSKSSSPIATTSFAGGESPSSGVMATSSAELHAGCSADYDRVPTVNTQSYRSPLRYSGFVCHSDGNRGLISLISGDWQTDQLGREQYIRFMLYGLDSFKLAKGDEVSFFIRKHENSTLFAHKVRLITAVDRSSEDIEHYISGLLETMAKYPRSAGIAEDIALAMTHKPVWDCVGRCKTLSDNGLSMLVQLLHEIGDMKQVEHNVTCLYEQLLQSDIFSLRKGCLAQYISHLAAPGSTSQLALVRELIYNMVRLVPARTRQLVALIEPMMSHEFHSNEGFIFRLLKEVVKGLKSTADEMEWNELPLVPTKDELMTTSLDECLYGCLQSVRTDSPYASAQNYFDTYFRLLRTECFSPMVKGLRDLLNGNLDAIDMNVYFGVNFAGIHLGPFGNGCSIGLKIAPGQAVDLDNPSNMMPGNLLCISLSGRFNDLIWATVVSRDFLKSHNLVLVEPWSELDSQTECGTALDLYFSGPSTVIIESPAYYRSYQPVLKSIQHLTAKDLVFETELVQCSGGLQPDYIGPSTTFDGCVMYPGCREKLTVKCNCTCEPNVTAKTLDNSQVEAIRTCLQTRVAIVQGPPGTGKTFIGVKLTQVILSMSTKPRQPILVITYKNHALDEFLKEIMETNVLIEVARVGGRSKEPSLNHCLLSERCKTVFKSPALYEKISDCKLELQKIKEDFRNAFSHLESQTVFTTETLLQCLSNEQVIQFVENCNWFDAGLRYADDEKIRSCEHASRYVQRLIRHCKELTIREVIAARKEEVGKKLQHLLELGLRCWLPTRKELAKFESSFAESALNRDKPVSNRHQDIEYDHYLELDRQEALKEHIPASTHKLKNAKEILDDMSRTSDKSISHLLMIAKGLVGNKSYSSLLNAQDIWRLTIPERILVIQHVLYFRYEEAGLQCKRLLDAYQKVLKRKEELENIHKTEVLRGMHLVGMTVTGANMNRHILEQLQPQVVLIEEAAEISEPHLLAVIGPWVKHLIMIGDHQQLRPAVKDYKLAREYHLNVSMMERLIKMGLPYATLTFQNRMRPEFAELLLDIYPDLQSNVAVVDKNKQAKCLQHSMYFWDRREPEKEERGFTNLDEAECSVRLALFLIEQGCKPQQVTLLSPYLGQVRLLRQKVQEAKKTYWNLLPVVATDGGDEADSRSVTAESIQVHTVDTYQGDENDFIIISLVRSNDKGSIGFMTQPGRRCVSQSRARCGMYFVGNKETFSRHKQWRSLIEAMDKRKCVGKAIPIVCPTHTSETQFFASTADQIPLNSPFCKKPCLTLHSCEVHLCKKTCQPIHRHDKCEEIVLFHCAACGVERSKLCHEDEESLMCQAVVKIVLSNCGHPFKKKCYENERDLKCRQPCPRTLTCGHPCNRKCGDPCDVNSCKDCEEIRRIEAKNRQKAERKQRRQLKRNIRLSIDELRGRNPGIGVHREVLVFEGNTAPEYFTIENQFKRYIVCGQNSFPRLVKIEKTINLAMEIKWLEKRLRMFDPTKVEQRFFDVQDENAANEIIAHGFKMLESTRSGIRFANVNKAANGNVLLLCDVLVGKSYTAEYPCNHKPRKLVEEKYDSVFARQSSTRNAGEIPYDEFIIYNAKQAIPRYLIYYEKVECVSCSWSTNQLEMQAMMQTNVVHHHIDVPKRLRDCATDELEMHFRIAESQFLRLMQRGGQNWSVESVDYYLNPPLMKKFMAMQTKFKDVYGHESEESKFILAFHGTSAENIANIVNTNFDITKLSKSTGCRGKYGAGIYFSEFPDFSMRYGGHGKLLLCRVLPGRTYDCQTLMLGAPLEAGYDSHRARADSQGRGQELVVFNADQILPCYVLNCNRVSV